MNEKRQKSRKKLHSTITRRDQKQQKSFDGYKLRRISAKKSVPKETRIPTVRVDTFSLVSLRFSGPWFIV